MTLQTVVTSRIRWSRRLHLLVRAVAVTAVVAATLGPGGGSIPPPALALPVDPDPPGGNPPGDPGGVCAPQSVSPNEAVLNGFVYVVDPPMVGHSIRIRISNPTLQLPDPRCDDGRLLNVPVTTQTWSVAERPAGSTANVTPRGVEAELVPDRSGPWRLVYTACPNGCYIPIIHMTLPARSQDITLTAVPVVEGRLSSHDLDRTLKLLLADSRIQISQTGNGTPVAGTPYAVRWNPPAYKWEQLCTEPPNAPPTWTPSPVCDPENRVKTLHKITPAEWSYIDFGPTAEKQANAPDTVPLPVSIVEREVQSEVVRGIFNFAFAGVFDVDRIRLMINNVHLELKGHWEMGGVDRQRGRPPGAQRPEQPSDRRLRGALAGRHRLRTHGHRWLGG